MSRCHFCKKDPYKPYIILLSSDIECLAMDKHIRDIYYGDTYEGEDMGVCEECRNNHFHKDNKWKVKNWFTVELQMELALVNVKKKKDKKGIATFTKALQHCKDIIKKAEEDPEVQAMYQKNNPAPYKKKLTKPTKCAYCGENMGQLWINNPNGEWKPETCWWVCTPCEKIIELQEKHSMFSMVEHTLSKHGIDTTKVKNDITKVEKEIDDVVYEDGQVAASFEISKKDDGALKVKEKKYG